ncbi:MAG TPA: UDP-N-acetylmuramoyl-tripeptide--D-alanyl-D-alanine ligase [Chloroflexota bacterium]|nr:UDP-N-acetylmuramoyl-tripeptide--D-alanyl-D-alanine ligase [Chloroflexota bacterium]
MDLPVGDIVAATAATLGGPSAVATDLHALCCTSVAIDSRLVTPGALFVALPGHHTDGALYGGDAYARGARAILTTAIPHLEDRHHEQRRSIAGAGSACAWLIVPDVQRALAQTAARWRGRHESVRVVAVTGSVGKTTTREAVAGVLSPVVPTLVAPRSYNNEIGLPLTLLGLEGWHRAAVLEMGMYARGEIAGLCALARPHIGVVTMVAPVHLERLGSIDAIAAAKAELVQALPGDGVAILNGDDPRVRAMASQTPARAVFFGLRPENDWRATEVVDAGLQGFSFTLCRGSWSAPVRTAIVGVHFIHALLAAAAVAEQFGASPPDIAASLGGLCLGERQRLLSGPRGRLIIDDSWNASVPSMMAALNVLAQVPRRRVAVLGEMLELGAGSEAAHRAVGRRAGEVVEALVAVGQGGLLMAEEARRGGLPGDAVVTVLDPKEVPEAVGPLLRQGDAVLVKGSRGLHLEDVVEWLMAA